MHDFRVKWGICKEKTRDFRLNRGFAKRKRDLWLKWGILEEKTRDFRLNGGFVKGKHVVHGSNGGFAKRKCVIFAYMGDLRRENARFSG